MLYCKFFSVVCFCALFVAVFSCDKKTENAPEMQKQVSGLDTIIPAGAKLEKVTVGYEFDTAGSPLYVTIKMDPSGTYHVLREDNGVTTTQQHSGKGTIYCCEMLGHRVVEMERDGNVLRVVCDEYNGRRIDGPNDIVVDSKGGIYFSDSQFIAGQEKMQETPAVYYVRTDGSVLRVIDNVTFPNGLGLSPDGKTLYVANTPDRYLLAYDVNPDGTVTNGRNFAEHKLSQKNIDEGINKSGADGMAVDSEGKIFVATTEGLGIQVFDPDGNHLGNIPCPAATNNCNFGGADMKTLYVSAKDGIYKIPVKIPGFMMP